jgi:putative Mn2+ efflux pump MntP
LAFTVMDFSTVLLIALGLAMDAFAVALGVGATYKKVWFRPGFRLSFHFGLFQFLMPVIGWEAGTTIVRFISGYDHWVAFGLLAYIGSRMIWESFQNENDHPRSDPTRKGTLVMLAIATSIDALAVGLSLAVLHVPILYPSIVIGIVAAGMTVLGLALGRQLSIRFGKRMELVGGLVLLGIGLRILFSHLGLRVIAQADLSYAFFLTASVIRL